MWHQYLSNILFCTDSQRAQMNDLMNTRKIIVHNTRAVFVMGLCHVIDCKSIISIFLRQQKLMRIKGFNVIKMFLRRCHVI